MFDVGSRHLVSLLWLFMAQSLLWQPLCCLFRTTCLGIAFLHVFLIFLFFSLVSFGNLWIPLFLFLSSSAVQVLPLGFTRFSFLSDYKCSELLIAYIAFCWCVCMNELVWYPCYALSFLVVIPYNLSSLLTVYFGFLLFVLPQVVTWSCDLTCTVCKWALTSKINCYKSSCRVQANSCWHLEHTEGCILWRATRGNHHNLSLSLSLSAWPSITACELLVPWCAFWYYYICLATGLITFEFFFLCSSIVSVW